MRQHEGKPAHALWVAACLAALCSFAVAQEVPSVTELPVTRVVLFTSGVAYFEHSGTVNGTQEVELPVATENMDDLLQSLVLQDFDGGLVQAVRYPSRDPLNRILGSYSLDLSGNPTMAQILSQARGESVRLQATREVVGVIVNVERVNVPEQPPRDYLTLATSDGLQRLALDEVSQVSFERPELQAELDAALMALARYRSQDDKTVRLRFEGEGERRVSVGYVREMPVWKTSYRLLLGDDGGADLQGWAIFDNPTHLDLVDVSVTFVAGRPISFIAGLFEPVYVHRPRVSTAVDASILPQTYDAERAPAFGAVQAAPMPSARADMAMMEDAFAPQLAGAGVEAAAEGSRSGATFAYVVSQPISVARFESTMIPIVQQRVEAHQLSVYDPAVLADHPLRGLRLVNDTDLHLAGGPVSVFDAGGFTGNALIQDIIPGDDRLLTYAVDLDLHVTRVENRGSEQVVAVRLLGSTLELSYRSRDVARYRIDARGDQASFLVIAHARRSGFEPVSPDLAPAETASSYRYGVLVAGEGSAPVDPTVPVHLNCEAGNVCELEVVTERQDLRMVAVSNVASEQIAFYLQNMELSAQDRQTLEQVVALQRELGRIDREVRDRNDVITAIHRDQDRIRQNMVALDRTSALYQRYLRDLESQEDQLDEIRVELVDLAELRGQTQAQLDALVAGLAED